MNEQFLLNNSSTILILKFKILINNYIIKIINVKKIIIDK